MTRRLILWSLLLAPLPAAAEPAEMFLAGKQGKLQAFLWKPEGAGPFPALVYNHGSEKEPFIGTQGQIGPFLSKQGYVVLFPIRRGAGKSDGQYWQDRVKQGHFWHKEKNALAALADENEDVVSAIAWLRTQPFVKGDEISVAGCSFGGIHTLLTAEKPLGLHAAIDFAGGAMAWSTNSLFRERLQQAAENAKVPVFFVQAENDFNTAPSKVLSEAMRKKKLPHRMRIFPPHGDTHMAGHGHFCAHGSAEWGADVLDFLKRRQ
jgi:carboxymethylenebutenolidase